MSLADSANTPKKRHKKNRVRYLLLARCQVLTLCLHCMQQVVTSSTPASTTSVVDLVVSSPDSDTFYSPSQVPKHVKDPIGEVFEHNASVIRRKIALRQEAAIDNLFNNPVEDNKHSSHSTEDSSTEHSSTEVPTVMPQSLQRLWNEVRARERNRELDFGMCPHEKCKYCRGPPMAQRHALMERLSQLEYFLYGT